MEDTCQQPCDCVRMSDAVQHLLRDTKGVCLCSAGWAHAGGGICSPKKGGGSKESLTILHRFAFTSTLKRMAVIVKACPPAQAPKLTSLYCSIAWWL